MTAYSEIDISNIARILQISSQQFIPPEYISPSEFTEKNIPIIDGPLAGSKTKLFPFQHEMIDVIDDPNIQRCVFMTSAQVSKTTIMNSQLCHLIANHDDNIIVAQATLADMRSWRNTKIEKVFECVPQVMAKMPPKRSKDYVNNEGMTQLTTGKYIYYVTLGSLSALRGKTARFIIVDELAAADQDTHEGSPLALLAQRQTTFGKDAKLIVSSTPTFKGDPIDLEFQASDQRHYHVPCYHCGEHQLLEWENVRMQRIPDPNDPDGKGIKVAAGAMYYCPHCEKAITDGQKKIMVRNGEWRKHNPGVENVAGFYINRLYSPFATWETIAQDAIDAYNKNSYQSFVNTSLGLPYTSVDDELDQHELMARRELFDLGDIPDDVLMLTVGADVQGDRIEATIVGWGYGEEGYVLHHEMIGGYTEGTDAEVWNKFDEFLKQKFIVNGKPMRIAATAVDSGFLTDQVLRWCAQRKGRNVIAVKGSSQSRDRFIPSRVSKSKNSREFWLLGVTQGKDMIFRRLNAKKKGRNSFRFSHKLDREYFEQITAEEVRTRYVKGFPIREYFKTRKRNEALDTLLYSLAAMKLLNPNWDKLANRTNTPPADQTGPDVVDSDDVTEVEQKPAQRPTQPIRRPRQTGGWLNGY